MISGECRSRKPHLFETHVATPITAVLDEVLPLTIRARRTGFLLRLAGHCSAAYPIPARPNKTLQSPDSSRKSGLLNGNQDPFLISTSRISPLQNGSTVRCGRPGYIEILAAVIRLNRKAAIS
jgi:hypothetical protein